MNHFQKLLLLSLCWLPMLSYGQLSVNATALNHVLCFGGNNGSATATATNGTAPYTYLWSMGAINSATITGLSAGIYTVTATDDVGATATASVTITEPTPLTATASTISNYNGSQVSCAGAADGAITATASGGVAPYAFLWSTASTTQTNFGLTAGTYMVTVLDANGCTASAASTIIQPIPITAAIVSQTNVTCFGDATGTATVTATGGGVGAYSFLWANGQTTPTATGLSAGVHCATVADANGCTGSTCVTITQPAISVVASINTISPVSCFGGNDGIISVIPMGGVAPYTFLWSNNGTTTQNNTGLAAGTYMVTVIDANGCTALSSTTVNQPTPITATIVSQTNVACFGAVTGSATVTATGGNPGYTFLWNTIPMQVTSTATGLSAGVYCVTVTDANGCTGSACVTITQPMGSMTATFNVINNPSSGNCNGAAQISASSGTAPYTFLWSTGITTSIQTGLCSGTYSATVIDANGCQASSQGNLVDSSIFVLLASVSSNFNGAHISCANATDGAISTTAINGTAPYTYLWSNAQTTANISGLAAGVYAVTATDAVGATATATVSLFSPTPININLNPTHITCSGNANGTAFAAATGGTAPYTYLWDNGQTTALTSGLSAGAYCVTVSDINNCQATACVTITQPTQVIGSLSNIISPIIGTCSGSAQITATGGTPPYTYHWSNASTSPVANGLCAGTISVTITDSNGCSDIETVTLVDSVVLMPIIAATSNYNGAAISCNGAADGILSVSGVGGTPPYNFLWSTGQTSLQISGLVAGTYFVTISDAIGGTAVNSYILNEPAALSLQIVASGSYCTQAGTGVLNTTLTGGTQPFTYNWSTGSSNSFISGLQAGTYQLSISDANGCTVSGNGAIAPRLNITHTSMNASCLGNDGAINLNLSSGNYTFNWSNGATTEDLSGLAPGTYTVQINNFAGCNINYTVSIGGTSFGFVTASYTYPVCQNANGAINQTVLNINNPQYLWNTGATTEDISGIVSGNYACTITDGNLGCILVRNYYLSYYSNCNISISGSVRNVVNTGTCIFPNSFSVSTIMLRLQPLGLTTFTDLYGNYLFSTTIPGNYTVELVDTSTQLCPTGNISINNAQQGSFYNNNNFYISDSQLIDASIYIGVQGTMRSGYNSNFRLYICNNSPFTQSDSILYHYDPRLSFSGFQSAYNLPLGLTYWDDTSNHTLHIHYQNLLPGQCQYIYMQFLLSASLQNGQTVCNQAEIWPIDGDYYPSNNYSQVCFIVGNSYDPNDKQVSPIRIGDPFNGGIVFEEDTTLNYLIRFQNLGAAPAYRVIVRDTLDAGLNPESIKNVQMSHNGQLELINGNILVCTFDSIELPHEAFDSVGSNGFLAFSIDRRSGQPIGTTINNQAHIYFDFNDPVITNMTTVVVGTPSAVEIAEPTTDIDFNIYPNPTSGHFNILCEGAGENVEISIYNALGQVLYQKQHSTQAQISLELQALAGIYFVALKTENANTLTKKLIIR